MEKVTKLGPGRYALGPLLVEKDTLLSICECPTALCRHGEDRTMRFSHWHVWDTRTDDYVPTGEEFDTKRAAVAFARKELANEAWVAEREAETGKTIEELAGEVFAKLERG